VSDINFALVEGNRPPLYTAMKYWGKKPHNIWHEWIKVYGNNGLYLDPFSGSAVSAFEAYRAGVKAIAFDLNPLSSFFIEVLSSKFDINLFTLSVKEICDQIKEDDIYIKYWSTESRKNPELKAVVQHYKWDGDQIYAMGILPVDGEDSRYMADPNQNDLSKAVEMESIENHYPYPDFPFPNSPSFNSSFIRGVGGNNFKNIWTSRSRYVLAKILNLIYQQQDLTVRNQLISGFIQSVHLCSKMCVPRNPGANRDFSTSWGRSAYLCARRKMEMNPLLLFENSCLGSKQSVKASLSSNQEYLGGKLPKLKKVSDSNRQKNILTGFDIKYGAVNVNNLTQFIQEKSIDFVMTDPPYGGLVQYLDLSKIWLSWLECYDKSFSVDLNSEITIKRNIISSEDYQKRFTGALREIYKVLKDDGKLVLTFHNKDISVWNAFTKSITQSGFKIEKIIHQQNARTGESNVSNPYGTSASDFYIRLVKAEEGIQSNIESDYAYFIKTKAIEILKQRSEPTPYEFLLTGLLTQVSLHGYDISGFDENLHSILQGLVGTLFKIIKNDDDQSGDLWWFINPNEHIKNPDKPLTDRIDDSIIRILNRKAAVTLDEVIAEIFIEYPNGLTPNKNTISRMLDKYATRSSGKFVVKDTIKQEFTRHTEIIFKLTKLAQKAGFLVYVGKREQPEPYGGKVLRDFVDITNLSFLQSHSSDSIKRLEMIDMVVFDSNKVIKYIFEVENSTNFMSGIQRGSNLDAEVKKIMVVPDYRVAEIKSIRDPLFRESFNNLNWSYVNYSSIERFNGGSSKDFIELMFDGKNLI